MRLIIICAIRNESDILEPFVRYHLRIADRLIIMNHRSVDSSAFILNSLQEEGLPVEIMRENRLEFQQSLFMTHLMRKAVLDYDADWVLPLDADEFITTGEQGHIREVLEALPKDKIIKVPWRTYVPLPDDDLSERNVLKRIQHCRRVENANFHKILVPRSLALKKNGLIAMGSHGFVRERFRKQKEFPYVFTDRLVLAHFPVRSTQQIMMKTFVSWLACLAKPNKQPTEAFHIKRLYDQFKNGGQISPQELSALAMGYATERAMVIPMQEDIIHMPVVPEAGHFEIRYTDPSSVNLLPLLAQLAEEFAEALGNHRRTQNRNDHDTLSKLRDWLRVR